MGDPEVLINGVRYVRADKAFPNATAIKQGLIEPFWGASTPDDIDEKWEGVLVYVDDSGNDGGLTIEEVLADIAQYATPNQEGE